MPPPKRPKSESTPLILASASPRRRELLKELRIPFQVIPSGLAEPPHGLLSPVEYARRLALAKARLVAAAIGGPAFGGTFLDKRVKREGSRTTGLGLVAKRCGLGIILGADTIVVHRGKIFGKPTDFSDACRILTALQGTTHRVITAVALVNAATGKETVSHAVSQVTLRRLSPEEVARTARKHLDKAGAYAVQEKRDPVVTKIQGSYSNVVGLPLEIVRKLLKTF